MVNNKEFTKRLAKKLNVTYRVSDSIIKSIQELVFESLEDNDKVKVGDFLVFDKKEMKEREHILPNSNEVVVKDSYIKLSANLTEKYKKQYK